MQENKSPVNDKEKGFALLRPDTIQLWVWLQGYQPLDEQPLKSLSEDISYRIRETSDVKLIQLVRFINFGHYLHLSSFYLVCRQFHAPL